ncbi:hypothetical protein C7212DRAFT_363291 [Tuber magnatum]|uniref:Uncharacterized protein n=1 Tax=Tuber magnatum TaxID=42249 RepID=A0A317STL5_9PEZI|nr:hypothetical protein C7212DRAFT_363291 [Tuber magnatum]
MYDYSDSLRHHHHHSPLRRKGGRENQAAMSPPVHTLVMPRAREQTAPTVFHRRYRTLAMTLFADTSTGCIPKVFNCQQHARDYDTTPPGGFTGTVTRIRIISLHEAFPKRPAGRCPSSEHEQGQFFLVMMMWISMVLEKVTTTTTTHGESSAPPNGRRNVQSHSPPAKFGPLERERERERGHACSGRFPGIIRYRHLETNLFGITLRGDFPKSYPEEGTSTGIALWWV